MLSPGQVGRLRRVAAEGLNKSEIARATGISRSTVRKCLRGEPPEFDRRRATCPVGAGEFARLPRNEYVYLLGLYLGDGTLSEHPCGVHR